jgi:hypothetical protein
VMPAKGKATVETYQLGLRLLAARRQAKHGEWLAFLRETGVSQPTAWRYMKFAERVKTEPRFANLREQERIYRRNLADERKHGRPDFSKGAAAVAALKAGARRGGRVRHA